MRLLSWNVQWCRGMDGRVDPKRIAAEARRAEPDVFCLQEIARNFPEMAGSAGEDQVEVLQREMPGYEAFFVSAIDLPGKKGRRRFGNLVMSRLPVGRVLRHLLPWPSAPDVMSMQRAAVEVVVDAPFGPLRVMTTHLEYYSKEHRGAQIDRLLALHAEACSPQLRCERAGQLRVVSASHERADLRRLQPAAERPAPPEDARRRLRRRMGSSSIPAGRARTRSICMTARRRIAATTSSSTPDLVPRLKSIRIDAATQASDHQPVLLELA